MKSTNHETSESRSSSRGIWRRPGFWLLVGGWSVPLGLLLCEVVSLSLPTGPLRSAIGPLLEDNFLLFGIGSVVGAVGLFVLVASFLGTRPGMRRWRKSLLIGGWSTVGAIVALEAIAEAMPPGHVLHMLMSLFSPVIAFAFFVGLVFGLMGVVLLFVRAS